MTNTSNHLPLSLVIITKNAGHSLANTLNACSWIEDIVIIDSGSTDHTQDIALRFGARFIPEAWRGFGPQKQFACEQAKYDWVLCLDADEVPDQQLITSIQETLTSPQHHVYRMKRCNQFLGRYLRYGEGYPDWCTRLFHRKYAQWSKDLVHEKVLTTTTVGELSGDLLHHSAETLQQYLDKQNRYTSIQAEQLFSQGKKISRSKLWLSPPLRFLKMLVLKRGFLDGIPGVIHIAIGCFNSFMKYAKLIELQTNTHNNNHHESKDIT